MTQDDNGIGERYVIEIEQGWQMNNGSFDALMFVRIFRCPADPRWPTRRQKPVIVLMAKEPTAESAVEQLASWFAMGQPDMDEAKARIEASS